MQIQILEFGFGNHDQGLTHIISFNTLINCASFLGLQTSSTNLHHLNNNLFRDAFKMGLKKDLSECDLPEDVIQSAAKSIC